LSARHLDGRIINVNDATVNLLAAPRKEELLVPLHNIFTSGEGGKRMCWSPQPRADLFFGPDCLANLERR
jgi:hypothetical protein